MMKIILLLMTISLLAGCFVIIKDDQKVKIFGESKATALDTLKLVDR